MCLSIHILTVYMKPIKLTPMLLLYCEQKMNCQWFFYNHHSYKVIIFYRMESTQHFYCKKKLDDHECAVAHSFEAHEDEEPDTNDTMVPFRGLYIYYLVLMFP